MLQEASSPTKYSDPSTGLLSPLIESQYVKLHKSKVKQQDARVDQFVQSRSRFMPPTNNTSSVTKLGPDSSSPTNGGSLKRSDSNGFIQL